MAGRYQGTNTDRGYQVPEHFMKNNALGVRKLSGLYIAKVIDIVDDRYEGFLHVEIVGEQHIGETDTKAKRQQYHRIRRCSPYGGSYQFRNFTNTYGMSSHPPAPGSQILVAFAENSDVGIMVGVLPDITRNSSVPSAPSGFVDSEKNVIGPSYDPSALKAQEKNQRPRAAIDQSEKSEFSDKVNNLEYMTQQGIGLDSIRGIGSSSQRRESPTNVFGFNTPTGHQFIMDDGTLPNSDTCLSPDKERQSGLSRLLRMRSAGGAQILFNDGAGIVYIINQNGNSWIQLGSDGKIDIYGGSDISLHTESNFNLQVGGDFNVEADTINMKSRGSGGTTFESATGEFNLHANKDIKLTSDLNGHIKCAGNMRTTAAMIDLNGPEATAATKPTPNNLTINTTVKESITGRVPEAEPWGGHAEQQEILPQVASATTEFTAKDIDLSKIENLQAVGQQPTTPGYQAANPRRQKFNQGTPQ